MTEVEFRAGFDVTLMDTMGDDERVCQAARVSNIGRSSAESGESAGLIRYLAGARHGSPFEHCMMQWMISCPIFVWREFHRHRIASYNEQSSRWMQLEPVFYLPSAQRPMMRKPDSRKGDYAYESVEPGSHIEKEFNDWSRDARGLAVLAYTSYERAIEEGVAGEVARMILPVSIYSTCWVTMNLRALMNFLSLRTAETAQYEIRQVALAMESDFSEQFPLVHSAWNENGRIAP